MESLTCRNTTVDADFFGPSYTRSTNAQKGKRSVIIETKQETSYEYSKTIRASDEGTYEVVAIRDKFCAFSTQRAPGKTGQKLLQYR